MKRITSLIVQSLIAILIGAGALAGNLQAQSDSGMIVSIPFPFTVGTQTIAPGTYKFSLVSGQFLLSVLNVKTGSQEMFRVHPEQQSALEPHGHLIFRNSEDRSVLNEVHFPSTDTFSEIIERPSAGRLEAKGSSTSNAISVGQR